MEPMNEKRSKIMLFNCNNNEYNNNNPLYNLNDFGRWMNKLTVSAYKAELKIFFVYQY